MIKPRLAAFALITMLLASCASIPPSQQEDSVLTVLQMLEQHQADELLQHSRTPFLLDAEIIDSHSDIAVLWNLLGSRAFSFPSPEIIGIEPVSDSSYLLFGDTMEVRVFFERYLSEDAAVAEIRAGDKTYRFIFADRIGGRNSLPLMFGWKGPL
ncbi:hypothetical protein [Spirochaeta dissipatitropha]